MIPMIVGDQNVVDPLQVGQAGSGHDAFGIAPGKVRPTRVDQQGLAGGRNNQRGLPAFNVDEIDAQILVFGCGRYRDEAEHEEKCSDYVHGGNPTTSASTEPRFWKPIWKELNLRATKERIRCWVSDVRKDCRFLRG